MAGLSTSGKTSRFHQLLSEISDPWETAWVVGAAALGFFLTIAAVALMFGVYVLGFLLLPIAALILIVWAGIFAAARIGVSASPALKAPESWRMVLGAESRASLARSSVALRSSDLFGRLSPMNMEMLATLGTIMRISEGSNLGKAGEAGAHLFLILEGRVQLSAPSALGELTVRIAGPGESFPLAALVGSGTLITSAVAMTDMEVLAIPRDQLLELCSMHPEIGMAMYSGISQVMAERYRKTLAKLTGSLEPALRAADFWINL